ncbi:MAG: helix-turn-helix domain-containing protein [Sphingobacteriaceae bacterium]
METSSAFTLVNSETGELAFKIMPFEGINPFDHLQRHNYSTIVLIHAGEGKLKADTSEYDFSGRSLMFFSPYQPFMISSKEITGVALLFHSDFFCTFRFDQDISCNGVLFNNIYENPVLVLDEVNAGRLMYTVEQMKAEMQNTGFGRQELLMSYLRVFLITASRLKLDVDSRVSEAFANNKEPFILQSLRNAIEANFRKKHSTKEYAELLNISPKALSKISKTHFHKTVPDLIAERIIVEAKRELYLTSKPVKSIAFELGFNDEFYFSRFFKTNTNVSPKTYRETVGFDRLNG